MKLSEGVEQAIHSVVMLTQLSADGVLSAASLAEYHGVKASYLLKHLQVLSGAGLLATLPGPKGGYRLARDPAEITLLDIVLAIEGREPAFRCLEIRQRGPNPVPGKPVKPCGINVAMLRAEQAYRAELRRVTVADILKQVMDVDDDGAISARGCAFLAIHERRQGV